MYKVCRSSVDNVPMQSAKQHVCYTIQFNNEPTEELAALVAHSR